MCGTITLPRVSKDPVSLSVEIQEWPVYFLGWQPDGHSVFVPGSGGEFNSCEGALNFVRAQYPQQICRVQLTDAEGREVLSILGQFS
jgi:hypothetical protein